MSVQKGIGDYPNHSYSFRMGLEMIGNDSNLLMVQTSQDYVIDLESSQRNESMGDLPSRCAPATVECKSQTLDTHVSNWGDERRSEISHLQTRETPLTV